MTYKNNQQQNNNSNEKNKDLIEAIVTETLPNTLFRLEVKDEDLPTEQARNEPILAYLAGKMRMHRIKVLVGDTVLIKLDPYGGRARIVSRL